MTLDAFAQHAATSVFHVAGRRTCHWWSQDFGCRRRGGRTPFYVYDRGSHDAQGAGTARGPAEGRRNPLRDESQPDAGGGEALRWHRGRHRRRLRRRDGRGAGCRHATRTCQLRRTRAKRQPNSSEQSRQASSSTWNPSWRCGALPTSRSAPVRDRKLRSASIPDFELKTSGMKMAGGPKQFGVDAERVPQMLQALGHPATSVLGFPHLQRLAEPSA